MSISIQRGLSYKQISCAIYMTKDICFSLTVDYGGFALTSISLTPILRYINSGKRGECYSISIG